jgi:hypothetical protein
MSYIEHAETVCAFVPTRLRNEFAIRLAEIGCRVTPANGRRWLYFWASYRIPVCRGGGSQRTQSFALPSYLSHVASSSSPRQRRSADRHNRWVAADSVGRDGTINPPA